MDGNAHTGFRDRRIQPLCHLSRCGARTKVAKCRLTVAIGALPTYLPRYHHALLPREEGLRRSISHEGLVFSDALRATLYGGELKRATMRAYKETTYAEIIARSLRGSPDDTAQALVINTWLTGNALLNCDKVTMAHSLEARVPFFDPALLDFAASVPPEVAV